jgi:fatty acid hydroxylase family protein
MNSSKPDLIRAAETARGRAVKRGNAVTALLAGSALAIAAGKVYGPVVLAPLGFLSGFVAGVLYANAFEYVLHRFFLHWGHGFLVQRHALHHNSAGAPDEARYVNFATSRLVVILLFLANAPAVFLVERLLHVGLAAGMFAGFTIYYVLYEEVHWRFHLGGWLPRWMEPLRRHHLLHHGDFEGRYNVFLPVFDWIFERRKWKRGAAGLH